jgi:two-component system response regulator LytT
MKIRLICDQSKYQEYVALLEEKGFEIDDSSKIVFEDLNRYDYFTGKMNNEIFNLSYDEISYIESYGHEVYAVTVKGRFLIRERLFEAFDKVEKYNFLRISISVIINKKHISSISATLNRKFHIRMDNGDIVDVTRTFYNDFKKHFGI